MSTPILSLSVLVLLCAAFPSQLFRFSGQAGSRQQAAGGGRSSAVSVVGWQLVLPIGMLLIAGWAWYLAPLSGDLWMPSAGYWFALAVALGCVVIAVEIGVGALWAKAQRRPVKAVALHGRFADRSAVAVVAVALVAVAEEIIFRGIAIWLLAERLGWLVPAAIVLTAVVYGLNHTYYGWLTVTQKIVTGVFYGVLYVLSGYALLVVVLAHVVQNVAVLTILPRLGVR
ncbi:CPBP family intramembrane glutamic endopeptidase [Natronoglycomyces albus]|uniref:CPBP family intramembrane metalloprotease n=1 Tax=Natronoglycomyces albus TaxID=2811108 RepID=A0A895XU52_9ACTN|nr:CPBP family intramembrane glutamic endopeptidase [Natronoglycomyces albus]QSB06865.1 CPBP family intramembrane metalloprotease [Natronoglycomyces albus]